jgi:hypothetical protein
MGRESKIGLDELGRGRAHHHPEGSPLLGLIEPALEDHEYR